jgi:6-phosphofructokinase
MTKKARDSGNFGIIVSGGPAPGINGVISACVVEASNRGYLVKGFKNGFKAASENEPDAITDLTVGMVESIYNTGGSILGTSRFNPFRNEETKSAFLKALAHHNIDKLVVIGGEGSAYLSYQMCKAAPHIQVVHIPKTIDNDLILPNKHPSFGFETARYAGTGVLETLMVDARTCARWFLVTSMGRKAGFLALGLGIASGAHISLIPEEFEDRKVSAEELARIVFSSVKKRYVMGEPYGIALMAEGILDCLDPESSDILKSCPRDEMGRIKYSQIELGDVIGPHLKQFCKEAGYDISFYTKNIGYELRCFPPVSFDIEYTRFLGYGAVRYLLEGKTAIMVTRDFDHLGYEPLERMMLHDGMVLARKVDLTSDLYQVALRFMTR